MDSPVLDAVIRAPCDAKKEVRQGVEATVHNDLIALRDLLWRLQVVTGGIRVREQYEVFRKSMGNRSVASSEQNRCIERTILDDGEGRT